MATGVLSNSLQMGRPSQKKDTATATSVTIGNDVKALQIGTIALVFTGESYEVISWHIYLVVSVSP